MADAHDVYLIFVPDSTSRLPRMAWRYDAVVRAMDDLGKHARVIRITEGELCRDVTHNFQTIEPDDYYPKFEREASKADRDHQFSKEQCE